MAQPGTITMSMRELDRLKVIQAVVEERLMPWRAAGRLGLSRRQVERLANRYRCEGAAGLVSRRRGRPGNHQLPVNLCPQALALIRERYADFGPTLACEKLHECHGITLSKETVRHLMTDAGLWIPRRQRPPKVYQPRARRACLGELVQIDGSEHPWFEERAPACTLLVYVDDATSRLMALHFTATESTFSYFEATRGYLERYGKPVAFYSDKASVFRSTHTQTGERGVTHFGRAMYELNIDTWCANSSSAKGRVERAHLTLQDRLVKELRLRGIRTIDAANAYAPAFIASYNAHFAKPPKSRFDAHRPLCDEVADGAVRPRDVPAGGHAGEPQTDPPVYRRVGVSGRAHRGEGERHGPSLRALRPARRDRSGRGDRTQAARSCTAGRTGATGAARQPARIGLAVAHEPWRGGPA